MENELVLIEEITAATFTKEGAAKTIERLKNIADHVCADVTTEEGEAELKSMASAFSRCKTPITDYKKSLTKEYKDKSKAIDEQGKFLIDNITELQAQVRKPLTDLENIEKAKKEKAIQEATDKLARLEKMEEEIKAKEAAEKEKAKRVIREAEIAKNAASEAKKEVEAQFKRRQWEISIDQKLQKEREDQKAKDVEHQRKVHGDILAALGSLPCSSDGQFMLDMKDIIKAIAKGKIPHLSIQY